MTGEFYFGSRSCACNPMLDIKYLGSMKIWNPNKANLVKEIIKYDFADRTSATKYEAMIITNHYYDDLNRNYSIPGQKFHTAGCTSVRDKNGRTYSISIIDERYLSKDVVSINTGYTRVKGIDGKCIVVKCNDERLLTGELVGIFKNKFHTHETKTKISDTMKDHLLKFPRTWISNDVLKLTKRIKISELSHYTNDGWICGRKYNMK